MAPRKKKEKEVVPQNVSNPESNTYARTNLIVAVIGLIGTLGAAYIGFLAIRSQSDKPMSLATKLHSTYPDGEIIHDSDGGFQTYETGVKLQDFVVDVDFIVPYSDHLWNNVISFRHGSRVWIVSSGEYGYGYFRDDLWHEDGPGILPANTLRLSSGSSNHMRFIASGSVGCLYVNDVLAEFVLPVAEPGNISIGISEQEDKIQGAITKYENLSIYTLEENFTSCPK